jgi:hypothetical protein
VRTIAAKLLVVSLLAAAVVLQVLGLVRIKPEVALLKVLNLLLILVLLQAKGRQEESRAEMLRNKDEDEGFSAGEGRRRGGGRGAAALDVYSGGSTR